MLRFVQYYTIKQREQRLADFDWMTFTMQSKDINNALRLDRRVHLLR